jgi:hypothetical protein
MYYVFGGVKLNSTFFPYQQVSISPELQKALFNSDVRSASSFTGIKTAAPMAKINSPSLASILNITGMVGAVLSAFEVYEIAHDEDGIASGSVHRKWSMTEAVAQVESISTSKGHAEISVAVHAVEDGTNAVWVLTEDVALPTMTRVTDVWYQGPLYVSTTLYNTEQITITPGAEVKKRHSNGSVGPTFVGLKEPVPVIAVSAEDGELAALAGAFGDVVGPVTIFFRKGAEGDGLRVANATETHISLVVPSVFMTPDGKDGEPRGEIAQNVTMDVRDDGTNAIWTLDTTAAIVAPT